MASNYDNAAFFYDPLSRLVFGTQLLKAQQHLLPLIKTGSSVLIVGGGAGRILELLAAVHPCGLQVTYVELSSKMIALAAKKNAGNNPVTFINKPIEQAGITQLFDAVITSFLFDSLSDETLPKVFVGIDTLLKSNGLWLNTDFQLKNKWWQPVLLKTMYLFFKITGCVDTTKLIDVSPCFKNYHLVGEHTFFGDFIFTRGWRKDK